MFKGLAFWVDTYMFCIYTVCDKETSQNRIIENQMHVDHQLQCRTSIGSQKYGRKS